MSVFVDEGPGQGARKRRLPFALLMGLVMVFMPGQVAGQERGEADPTAEEDRAVEDAALQDPAPENPALEDRAVVDAGLVPNRPRVRPTRIDTPPVIDGRLDEEVWKSAALITEFVQQAPLDGAPATEETEV